MMMLVMYDEVVGANESSPKSPCFEIQDPQQTRPDVANACAFPPDIVQE